MEKIRHNAFHRYLIANHLNDLQKEVLAFLDTVKGRLAGRTPAEIELDSGLEYLRTELKSGAVEEGFEEEHYELEETDAPKSTPRNPNK